MEEGFEIVDTLTSVFTYWQDRQETDELLSYMNQYLYLPQCRNFIIANLNNMKNRKTEELHQIYEELMQRGESVLAQKVNTLVSGDNTISEESYILLENYSKTAEFNKKLESTLLNLNRPSE
jgi:uncharacterized protein (UPF0297 family)